jgi:SAM-dependent methyltransferase
MHPELVGLLACPECRGSLELLDSPTGAGLICRACGSSYPVRGGVPRLASQPYVASFGRQWNSFDVARDEEDLAVFKAKTGWDLAELSGKFVLDAGCGGGRYARLLGRAGANVVALDLSDAVEKAASLCADLPNVLVVQADLLNLPLSARSVDFAFSIGVLHHSPNARAAFDQVAKCVKPGGRMAIWLYRMNTPPQEWINSGLRAVTMRMPPRVLEWLCAGLGVAGSIPIVNKTLNKIFNFSNHSDWTLRVCDNFDWYAPRFQSHHTVEELLQWFRSDGFVELVELQPLRTGRMYNWAYRNSLIIGSGVNVVGRRGNDPGEGE